MNIRLINELTILFIILILIHILYNTYRDYELIIEKCKLKSLKSQKSISRTRTTS